MSVAEASKGMLLAIRAVTFSFIGFLARCVAVWIAILVLVAIGEDIVRSTFKIFDTKLDRRASLPNYPDHDYAVRIYRDEKESTRQYVPFVEWKEKPIRTTTLNINDGGFREHTVGRESGPGTKTIGFFGGSAMFGIGADDNHTIPAQFDAITTGYDVTNYASAGWTSRQNLAQLMNLVVEGSAPKVVVFYDGFNNVRDLCNRAVTNSLTGTSMERRYRALMDIGRSREGTRGILIAPILDLIKRAKTTVVEDYICSSDPQVAQKVADTIVRTWVMADQVVSGYGGQFFGFLQPSVFTGHPRLDHLPPDIDNDGRSREKLQHEFNAVYPLVLAELARTHVKWTDITDAYDGDEYLYVDFSHVSENGNAIIARRMFERIAQSASP